MLQMRTFHAEWTCSILKESNILFGHSLAFFQSFYLRSSGHRVIFRCEGTSHANTVFVNLSRPQSQPISFDVELTFSLDGSF